MNPRTENLTPRRDAGGVSLAQVLVYELRVRDAMTHEVRVAGPADSLRSVQLLMKEHRISGVPIVRDGALLGIVSIEDIVHALDKGHINDAAEAWMTRDPVSMRDHYSLVRAVAEFDRYGFGRFPVLDAGGRLVGIITRGDITSTLMHHLERRAEEAVRKEAERTASSAAASPDEASRRIVLTAEVRAGDFDSAGKLSQRLREILRARGVDPNVRRRATIVAYEAETNIIIHSIGGQLTATVGPDRVSIDAEDQGPGIENLDLAMQEGWSTAGPLARKLGFGAGMGLPNIRRSSDHLDLKSSLLAGTRLHAEVLLQPARAP
jgi:CBS domain-containing protein/anti-sigma regulatory factor (Ser/Thr protein kinase)